MSDDNLRRLALPTEIVRSGFELFLKKDDPEIVVSLKTHSSGLVEFFIVSPVLAAQRNVFKKYAKLHASYTEFWQASGLHGSKPHILLTCLTPEENVERGGR